MKPAIAAALVASLAACGRRDPLTSCTDDLRGVYVIDDRPRAERWMILDHRTTLEAYPLFDDVPEVPAGHEIAPRVIDLERTPEGLSGQVRRRYMQGAVRCEARVPVHVTACAGDTLDLVLADPVAPLGYEPCTWPRRDSSRRERWRRE